MAKDILVEALKAEKQKAQERVNMIESIVGEFLSFGHLEPIREVVSNR